MGFFKGGALRFVQTGLYFLIFCCAAVILGIYSYFLAVLSNRNLVVCDYHVCRCEMAADQSGRSGRSTRLSRAFQVPVFFTPRSLFSSPAAWLARFCLSSASFSTSFSWVHSPALPS